MPDHLAAPADADGYLQWRQVAAGSARSQGTQRSEPVPDFAHRDRPDAARGLGEGEKAGGKEAGEVG
jgi:hypothetical protein